jgi:replication factor A2
MTHSLDYGYGNNYTTTTSYGAQGGADGGGFMGGEGGSSPAGGKVRRANFEEKISRLIQNGLQGGFGKDTVRPVTIKQILDAQQPHPDADFRVDGENISQVCDFQVTRVSLQF